MAGKAYPLNRNALHIRRALLSVSDKSGLANLVGHLHKAGVELYSTGGTYKEIERLGIPVTEVSTLTHFQECLDGRVKTLHPAVHAGLLARMDVAEDQQDMVRMGYEAFQLLVVNLYPFEATIARNDVTFEQALEQVDIGGPAMIRAAAKNLGHVCVLSHPEQYPAFTAQLTQGSIPFELRLKLSMEAYNHIARYDSAIANYMMQHTPQPEQPWMHLSLPLYQSLRYGENPHQHAAVYGSQQATMECFHGKELSYNNFLDLDAALALIREFDPTQPTCAILKHTVACGVAVGETLTEAYQKAFKADTISPFGGIIIFNQPLDDSTAQALDPLFSEMVVAPAFSEAATERLTKKANRRLVKVHLDAQSTSKQVRSIFGGILVQEADHIEEDPTSWTVATQKTPTAAQWDDMRFAWNLVKHVKSNGIVLVRNRMSLGIGTGQTSRVDATEVAIAKALKEGHELKDSILASDAFFPFADGVEMAAQQGISCIVQPGGSVRDQEVIEMADKLGITMVFTGLRHFRH